jgi:signal transduction histidine kinase
MDVNEAVEGAFALVAAQARLGAIAIVKDLAPELPKVFGNPNQVQQVVINLANNALDAMDSGGTLSVRTALLDDGQRRWVCIYVGDTGRGIPPEVMPRIFEPFFTTKPLGKGIGLGLGLVHEIMEKHSGTVEAISRPGQTEFCVKFPVRRAERGVPSGASA